MSNNIADSIANPIENEIQKRLLQDLSPESIGQSLVESLNTRKLAPEEINSLGFFLYNTGQFPLLFTAAQQLAQDKQPIPWGAFTLALMYLSEKIPASYLELILEGARSQGGLLQVLPLKNLEPFSPNFTLERQKYLEQVRSEYQQLGKDLLSKIAYFKSQRMIDEEGQTIDDFKAFFPHATDLEPLREDFERRKAEHLISKMGHSNKRLKTTPRVRVTPPPANLQPWITLLVKECRNKANKSPQTAIDLSLMFYFFELYNEALAVLSIAPETESVNWLRLEIKVLAGRYVDAMEDARRLEQLYANDPDSTFATTYARALCLWELGQSSLAISLLQSIVNIRPYFREAHSLLKQWTEESP